VGLFKELFMIQEDDIYGVVAVYKNGELVERKKNLITTKGREWVAWRVAGHAWEGSGTTAANAFPKLVLGTSSTAPTLNDQAIGNEAADASTFSSAAGFGTGQGRWNFQYGSYSNTISYMTTGITATTTSVNIKYPELLPAASTSDPSTHYYLRINDSSGNNIPHEIVKVTHVGNRIAATESALFSFVRAQQGTSARTFYGPIGNNERNYVFALTPRTTYVWNETYQGTSTEQINEAALMGSWSVDGSSVYYANSRIVFSSGFNRRAGDTIKIIWDIFVT